MAKAVALRSYTGWTDNRNHDWDIALVTLDRSVGNTAGWLGIGANSNTFFQFHSVATAGYPGDKFDVDRDGRFDGWHLWLSSGVITAVDTNQLGSGDIDESDETFTARLVNLVNAEIVNGVAVATIIDDDPNLLPVLSSLVDSPSSSHSPIFLITPGGLGNANGPPGGGPIEWTGR